MKPVLTLLTSLIFLACNQDKNLIQVNNQKPEIEILEAAENVVFSEGNAATVTALVFDNNEVASNLEVLWRTNDRVVCDWSPADEEGIHTCEMYPRVVDTKVIAVVKDSRDAKATAEFEVVVNPNQPPVVEIEQPYQNWNYYSSHPVPLQMTVSDDWTEATEIEVAVASSLDGAQTESWTINSDGQVNGDLVLTTGEHSLSIRATDEIGAATLNTIIVRVGGENTPPGCELNSGSELLLDYTPSEITGLAQDVNVPSEYLTAEWSSDRDGFLGENTVNQDGQAMINTILSPGIHLITMTISDEVGDTCEASRSYFVNSKPVLSVAEWTSTGVEGPYSVGEEIAYDYTVEDQTDPTEQITVTAYSDIDGSISQSSPSRFGEGTIELNGLTAGIHTISLIATDPHGSTDTVTTRVHINTPPTILEPYVTEAHSNTDLEFVGLGDDADGDPVSISYTWSKNGQPTNYNSAKIPKVNIVEGDLWMVTATPNDGFVDGLPVVQTLIVQNAPPTIANHEILPTTVYNDSLVSCSSTAFDPDETVAAQYDWIVNGVEHVGSSLDLSPLSLSPFDEIICRATVSDSTGQSTVSTVSSILQNRDPLIQNHSISPSPLLSNEDASCISTVSDPDNDAFTTVVSWTLNGSPTNIQTSEYTGNVAIGDTLACTQIVTDEHGATGTSTASAIVANTPPVVYSMSFTPDPPNLSETLMCTVETGDSDGHTTTLSVDFQNLQTGNTQGATMVSPTQWTIDPALLNLNAGEDVACVATVTDSLGDSTTASISATFADTPPSITVPTDIDANLVEVGDSITCSMTAVDVEDGNLSSTYEWFVGGNAIATGATYIVDSTVPVGSTIQCVATAVDSTGNSVSDQSVCLMQNSDPTVDSITITPVTPFIDSTMICDSTVSDVNGTVYSNTTWSRNGTIIANAETLDLTTIQSTIGDTFICTVNAVDQDSGVTSATAAATIVNRLPDPPTINITPEEPIEGIDDLVCQITSGTIDADGQNLTFSYEWLQNGVSYGTTSTVDASDTIAGDEWTCDVRAFDGTDYSPISSASVTIVSPCFWGDCDTSIPLIQTGVDFVEIPNGLFEMGSPTNEVGRYVREELHYVYLSRDFNAMTTEVTQEMFQMLMGYNPSFFGSTPADQLYGGLYDCGDDCPVEFVTWHEAALFSNRLTQFVNASQNTNLQECYTCSGSGSSTACTTNNDDESFYDCTGFRLPTEAEWEYMTKGSGIEPFNDALESGGLPSGDNAQGQPLIDSCVDDISLTNSSLFLDELGWYCFENIGINGDSTYGTKPIAQKSPNIFGLYDVYGNVREWTQDAYLVSLGTTLTIDPYPTSSSSTRVTKGGYWGETPRNIRAGARFSNTQSIGLNGLGFRVVQTKP